MTWSVVTVLAGPTISHAAPIAIFPADVADSVWWSDLAQAEPPLWRPTDLNGHKMRIRLSIAGISTLRIVVRIDEDLRGRFKGRALLVKTRGGQPADISEFPFAPTQEQMDELRAKIGAAKLWSLYPEHWINDDICVDGEQMVFEKVDQQGYHFSEANAQCTAPAALLEVGRLMIRIARVPEALPLLN